MLFIVNVMPNMNTKAVLYRQYPILGFTQYLVIGYACCMLIVFLRVQMSILGGIMCQESEKEVSVISCVVITELSLCRCYFVVHQIRMLIQ